MDFDSLNITRLEIRDLETKKLGVQQLTVESMQLQLSTPVEVVLCLAMVTFLLMCVSTVCYHYHRLNSYPKKHKMGSCYTRVGHGEAI